MNKRLRQGFALIGIMLFVGAFFWVSDVYDYLDQQFWHITTREPSIATLGLWPLSWIAAFMVSVIPFFIIGFISLHFQYEELKQKELAELELEKAKKASNLYVNTNASASAETPH